MLDFRENQFDFITKNHMDAEGAGETNKSTQEILSALGCKSILDIKKGHVLQTILFDLEDASHDSGYFDLAYIREMIRLPLETWSITLQKALLKSNVVYLIKDGLLSSEELLDELSDEEITDLFDEFREGNMEYYLWLERSNLKSRYADVNNHHGLLYNVDPLAFADEEDGDLGMSFLQKEKARTEYTFCRFGKGVGVIYDSYGRVQKMRHIGNSQTVPLVVQSGG